ncbi:unnamed protein product [Schistosoma margrebowiei]|uniref:Uncharacterized protein n=1 Tax=Schistosoma margrebowiei TaxID=48269 RepID=A0A183MYT9_9TREM|nr:unnamed protein product [Schistosoma margrebowiei]
MAYGKQTVWLATENSSRISLYHATTGEFLMEIDLKPIVLQRLQGEIYGINALIVSFCF